MTFCFSNTYHTLFKNGYRIIKDTEGFPKWLTDLKNTHQWEIFLEISHQHVLKHDVVQIIHCTLSFSKSCLINSGRLRRERL